MSDRTYGDLDLKDQLRVNAVIISALTKDQPAGIKSVLEAAASKPQERSFLEAISGNPEYPAQKFLNTMRDTLAALPMDGADSVIPPLSGEVKSPESSLDAQRSVLKNILRAAADRTDAPAQNAMDQSLKAISPKLVYQGNVGDLPIVNIALTNFVARESVSACQSIQGQASHCTQETRPAVPQKQHGMER